MTWKPKQLTTAQLEERRIAAVAMLTDKTQKKSQYEVAKIMGVSRIAVYKWYKRAKQETLKAVARSGRPCRLNPEQLERLSQLIQEPPSQHGYETLGWTTKLVADLIEREFKVQYSPDHAGVIMHKIGLSVQKPKKRGLKRDQKKIDQWVKEEFPALKKWVAQGYQIMFSDECHSSLAPIITKTWAKVGEAPIVKVPSRREGVSLIGAITACGKVAVQYTKDKMNGLGFVGFLEHVLKTIDGKMVLFVDNHRMHKTAEVLAFVERHQERLALEYTPCYAPECNPIEWLWSYVKGLLKMRVMPSIEALLEFWDQAICLAVHLKYPAVFFACSAIGNVS